MIKKLCDECKKLFEGHTEFQVDHQIAVHKLSRHNKRKEVDKNVLEKKNGVHGLG